MSVESAKAFMEKFKSDDAFRAQLENAPSDEARKQIVKDAGFEFTAEEIKQVTPDELHPGKLSEADLEAVAGGGSATWAGVGVAAVGAAVAAA